jgi:8-oxo-dGTP pyrophosphatase MutT (NUDIX family)
MFETNVPAHPAATVILMKDTPLDFEILLLKRNAQLDFHGGDWVFPGGRIDPKDYDQANPKNDIIAAARVAAVRETFEEAGLKIDKKDLVFISRWTTPRGYPKRFKTWFFLCRAPSGTVSVDNQEMTRFKWFSPQVALEANNKGEIQLPGPTFHTIQSLIPFSSSEEALQHFASQPPLQVEW